MTVKRTPGLLIAIVLLLAAPAAYANPQATDAGVEAATAWLGLVDGLEYDKSWDEAAGYFKNAVPKEQWEQSMTAVREPLGDLVSRQLESAGYETALPGAPDGEYVVMQFATSFSAKAEAVETVTVMRETDGTWRMAGYFIK